VRWGGGKVVAWLQRGKGRGKSSSLATEGKTEGKKAYLQGRVKGRKPDLRKLDSYAKALRVSITPYVEAFAT